MNNTVELAKAVERAQVAYSEAAAALHSSKEALREHLDIGVPQMCTSSPIGVTATHRMTHPSVDALAKSGAAEDELGATLRKVLGFVRAGLTRPTAIGKAAGYPVEEVRHCLKELRAAGLVRLVGERGGAKWLPA